MNFPILHAVSGPKVTIVDDDDDGREELMDDLRECNFEPVAITGSFGSRIDDLITEITALNADFVICDHRLQPKQMAQFYGVEVVKRLLLLKQPAMLLTMYGSSDRLELRRSRFDVPVIIARDEFAPEALGQYIDICEREIANNPVEERRPHRVLLRIEHVSNDQEQIDAVIPSWREGHAVPIPIDCIAEGLRNRLTPGAYLIGQVNIGASTEEELFFHDFNQFAPPPKDSLA